jgi:hypothetical protein
LRHNMDIRRIRTMSDSDKARLEKYHHAWRILTD